MVYGIIMAGGRGERFWPLSRAEKPKQFLRLTSERTMLDETIERIRPLIPIDNVRIVTGESMAQMVQESTGYLQEKHILAEPFGRNTSLAIALAAAHLYQTDKKAVMVVLSADHLIRPAEKLLKVLKDAGVVDSGGKGLFYIFEGMQRYSLGLPLDEAISTVMPLATMQMDESWDQIEPGQDFEVVVDFRPSAPLDLQSFYYELEKIGTSIQVGEGGVMGDCQPTHRG